MPTLFLQSGAHWNPVPVPECGLPLPPGRVAGPDAASRALAWITPISETGRCALLVRHAAQVRHNGLPVTAGLRLLSHRDRVDVAQASPAYFSGEEPARVVAYQGAELPCPRCRRMLQAGSPVVRCPACGVTHHEGSDLPCWTYARGCAVCGHTTLLTAAFQWTPDSL